jgi:predicted NBD/HSP70 family sugar kinase
MSATGVDISGTKTADSVVSPEGKVLNKVSYPTQAVTPNQLVETIADAATEVKDGFPVGGVYLGTVCVVSRRVPTWLYSMRIHRLLLSSACDGGEK